MFIGIANSIGGGQSVGTAGAGGNPHVIGTSRDGNYPLGIQSGDYVVTFATSDIPVSMPPEFSNLESGNLSGNYYFIGGMVADGTETGLIGAVAISIGCFVIRGQSYSNIVTEANNGSSWTSLSGLTANSLIVAAGYSATGGGAHGGETIAEGFTTYQAADTVILAIKDELEPTTEFTYDGFVNSGTVQMCYSIGIG